MIYNIKKFTKVKNIFRKIGIITMPWGSVAKTGKSTNDMDLIIMNHIIDGNFIDIVRKLFDVKKLIVTNWGGIYLKTNTYGNIDLFPESYFNSRCYKCKKKCGW